MVHLYCLSDIKNNTIPQQWRNIQSINSSAVYLTKVIIEKRVKTQAIDYVYSTSKSNKDMPSCNAYKFEFATNTATKLDSNYDCFLIIFTNVCKNIIINRIPYNCKVFYLCMYRFNYP